MYRYLLARQGQVIGKAELMDAVWPNINVTENSLYQCISDIRRALSDHPVGQLQTVPRQGYRLVISGSGPVGAAPRSRDRRWAMALPTLFGAAAVAALSWHHVGDTTPAGGNVLTMQTPGVAILPFAVTTDSDRWTLIGENMSTVVARGLSGNSRLRVFGRDAPRDQAAFELKGRLNATSGAIGIEAHLLERDTGRSVWSQSWQGPEGEFLALQARMAQDVAAELGGPATDAETLQAQSGQHRPATENLEAYALYLRGVRARRDMTPEAVAYSRDYLTRATALDPDFAEAWLALSVTLNVLSHRASSRQEATALIDARAAAVERAVALAPDAPATLIEQAWLYALNREFNAAREAVRHAVARAGADPEMLTLAAMAGNIRVDLGEAGVGWVEKARRLSPAPRPRYDFAEGHARFTARDWAGAVAALERAPAHPSRFLYQAVAEAKLGKDAAARQTLARLHQDYPEFSADLYVYVEAVDMELNGRMLIEEAARLGLPRGDYPIIR
ncbi:MAG: winged helix-turn-helix domain-containing protein [Roseivivax sp.]|nr:winged helix-turn-helix domain-containing protein [Roseivivax sp.]